MNNTDFLINAAALILCTEAEGPGKRAALWVQGCARRCEGCCNPEMQPFSKRHIVSAEELFDLIKSATNSYGIEGITLVGGEPVLQAKGLSKLAEMCRENGLSVVLFSGYTYEQLAAMGDTYVDCLLKNTDILIDGEFVQEQYEEERAWVGSRNQKFHYLSDRYSPGIEYEEQYRTIEFRIGENDIKANGWPFL